MGRLVIGRCGEGHDELRFIQSVTWQSRASPMSRAQVRERTRNGIRIRLINWAAAFHPVPLIVRASNKLFVRPHTQPMNLLRLETEDRRILPLKRIGPDLIEQRPPYCDDKRFVADVRVNVITFHFSKCDGRKRLLARFCFGRVFGSE